MANGKMSSTTISLVTEEHQLPGIYCMLVQMRHYMEMKGREKKSPNLVQGRGQDRHEEAVVDVANQLVSDIRVGHLGTANVKTHVSQERSQSDGCSH